MKMYFLLVACLEHADGGGGGGGNIFDERMNLLRMFHRVMIVGICVVDIPTTARRDKRDIVRKFE